MDARARFVLDCAADGCDSMAGVTAGTGWHSVVGMRMGSVSEDSRPHPPKVIAANISSHRARKSIAPSSADSNSARLTRQTVRAPATMWLLRQQVLVCLCELSQPRRPASLSYHATKLMRTKIQRRLRDLRTSADLARINGISARTLAVAPADRRTRRV